MPTIIDLLRESPEVGDQLKRLDAAFNRMAEIFRPLREFAAAAIQRVAESDPSLGYEPMLVERRVDRIVARMTARLLVRKGTRIARESQFSQPVVNAIRFLARSRRQSAILRRAQFLLGVCEKTSTVQTIFCKAGLDESEFIRALKLAVEGDQLACRRVTEIAVSIASRLSNSRGPKVRAASAAHEALLEDFSEMTGRRAYTWSDDTGNDDRGDFTDPLTEATRLEFESPDFDPRSARRRINRRKSTA